MLSVADATMTPEAKILEHLEQISFHLKRLDARDRMRTWGGFVRGIIALIPIVLFIVGAWYAYTNTDALIKRITAETTKQMMQSMPNGKNFTVPQELIKQVQEMIKK